MWRPVEARALLSEARTSNPALPATYEVEGIVLELERQSVDAQVAYQKAVDLGSTNFYPYCRVAALTPPANADAAPRSRLETSLERSVALNGATF